MGPKKEDFSRSFKAVEEQAAACGVILSAYRDGKLPITLLNVKNTPITREAKVIFPMWVLRDMLFIRSLSLFEYELLQIFSTDQRAPKTLKHMKKERNLREVKLWKLVHWINDDNLLDDLYLWQFALKARNDIVHYDAYARETMISPKIEHEIKMKQGEQIEGNLRSIISLTKAIESSLYEIIVRLTKK